LQDHAGKLVLQFGREGAGGFNGTVEEFRLNKSIRFSAGEGRKKLSAVANGRIVGLAIRPAF
jgi:hypothetical protein